MGLLRNIKEGDWIGIKKNFQQISSTKLGPISSPTFAGLTLTGLTDYSLLIGSSTGVITSLGAATNGQIPIGSTGVDPVLATITGTTNQVNIANAAGSITLSAPQDIHTGASPTFAGLDVGTLSFSNTIIEDSGGSISFPNTNIDAPVIIANSILQSEDVLSIKNTANAWHTEIYSIGTSASAIRAFYIELNNADRILTLSGNPTLADWFNQSVKTTASPTFTYLNITDEANGYQIDGSKFLSNEGTYNIQLGTLAGDFDVGENNVFIGYEAGRYNDLTGTSEGRWNVYIGKASGKGTEGTKNTGHSNVGVGLNTLLVNQSGFHNMAIGKSTLELNTTGSGNVAIGTDTLKRNNDGSSNIGIGRQCLTVNISGTHNIAIGTFSMITNTGGSNIGIGSYALRYQGTGQDNVAIGYYAGRGGASAANFSENVYIGYRTGYNSTGSSNVFIGYRAGYDETGSDTLIIDNEDAGTEAQNRAHALLYGLFENHASGPLLKINGNLYITIIKSGATQAGAGAAANEIWKTASHATLPDNVLMMGV